MRKYNAYQRGLNRNVRNNIIAGIIIAIVLTVINLLTGCEQPELQQNQTSIMDSLQLGSNDSIESWEEDTAIYHTTTKTI